MKNKIFFLLVFTVVFSVSCEKVLDKQSLTQLPESEIFANTGNLTLFVNGIYSALPNGFNRGWYMLDAATSDAENSYAWASSNIFNRSEQGPSNTPNHDWDISFAQIRNCNIVLAGIDALEGDTDIKNRLKGEVFFLRGFYFSEMYKRYGGVPIITTVLALNDDFKLPRATAEETINQIVSDLDAAAALLPAKYSGNNIGRATSLAALSLKGRMLLYAEKFPESEAASKAAIDLAAANSYNLHTPYDKVFLDNNNPEVIFDKQLLAVNFSQEADLFNMPVGFTGGWGGTSPTQDFVDSYEMVSTGLPINTAGSGYNANNPYVGRDPRFDMSVLYNGSAWRGRLIDTRVDGIDNPTGNGDATKTGYYMRKFMDQSIFPQYQLVTGNQNWILIRLGEVYLNYAEALLKQERAEDARPWVNKIRERAGMPDIPAGALTWERYMNERRVELSFEEHRFWDVRRWKVAMVTENKPAEGMRITGTVPNFTYTRFVHEERKFEENDYLFAIPQGEIDKDPNLQQNPGW